MSLVILWHFVLRKLPQIVTPIIYLVAVGWVELLRLKPELATKQSLWLLISSGFCIVVYRRLNPISLLERYRNVVLTGGLLLLFSALIFGVEVNGAKLWLRIGASLSSPSKLSKFS